jgi:hypothetical protein
MRNLLVVLVAFIQAVLPVWAQGIPASSSGAGGQAVAAVVQGISAAQVSNMIASQSSPQCPAGQTYVMGIHEDSNGNYNYYYTSTPTPAGVSGRYYTLTYPHWYNHRKSVFCQSDGTWIEK